MSRRYGLAGQISSSVLHGSIKCDGEKIFQPFVTLDLINLNVNKLSAPFELFISILTMNRIDVYQKTETNML